jgi:heme-degrading monooxygenase HmoA
MIPRRTAEKTPLGSLKPAEQPMTLSFEDGVAAKLNGRLVEFIAKPGQTDKLRGLLCQAVTPLLRDRTGFIRTIVLTKLEERRQVVVITLWKTEEQTVNEPWEETPLMRELLSPLIDAWSSTRSYEVHLTEVTEAHSHAINVPVC